MFAVGVLSSTFPIVDKKHVLTFLVKLTANYCEE